MSAARLLNEHTSAFSLQELQELAPASYDIEGSDVPKFIVDDGSGGSTALLDKDICDDNDSTVGSIRRLEVVRPAVRGEHKASVWEKIIQSWEGRVVFNSPDDREFTAIISDRTCRSNPDEEVVIGYEHVLDSDKDLIEEGAVFYWNIGRYRKYSKKTGKIGPSENKYEIRFRRLPNVDSRQVEKIIETAQRISAKIHGY
ncbi:hypothetical protein E0E52_19710 [Azotobacter chroococcum]|uniref:hypothetical protein n=1 Tax=Azotobacter chroococcum TaxID=353 RepID=UPI00103F6240|nr:hypothetical protein [Azotobacter chroococcum]TBW01367.1 hypothetical protein E0E52_19710 [Azotobacter chroococcum]